jgi:hypothetical protein
MVKRKTKKKPIVKRLLARDGKTPSQFVEIDGEVWYRPMTTRELNKALKRYKKKIIKKGE